jgi:hypothetical protein
MTLAILLIGAVAWCAVAFAVATCLGRAVRMADVRELGLEPNAAATESPAALPPVRSLRLVGGDAFGAPLRSAHL